MQHSISHNNAIINELTADLNFFNECVKRDKDGNILNPVRLNGINTTESETVGVKLNEISKSVNTRGEYREIGELYGFRLLVKSELSAKDETIFSDENFIDNRFFVQGQSGIKYTYNNGRIANSPKLASLNFLNALLKIPEMIDSQLAQNERLKKDIPVLQEIVNGKWRKEDELKKQKTELSLLERKIKVSLEKQSQQLSGNSEEGDKTDMSFCQKSPCLIKSLT